jgi:integrase
VVAHEIKPRTLMGYRQHRLHILPALGGVRVRELHRGHDQDFRVYDLRHTFASLLMARGVPLTPVNAQLGHALPTTTL